MDCVSLVPEETVEGMTPEKEEADTSDASADTDTSEAEEVEYDEHVWTSPS